jgi:hypothetical protein
MSASTDPTPPAKGKRAPFDPTFDECRRYFEDRLHRTLPAHDSVSVLCPFHPDKRESLSLNLRKGLWHCHACNIGGGLIAFERRLAPGKDNAECWKAIYSTIGRDAPKANESKHGTLVATYDYRDADGEVVYQAVRYEPKGFSQRRPDGKGGWVWNMDGVTRVPFNLPTLITANVALIVEGEKDALNLQEAATRFPDDGGKLRYAATCNVGGAGKWLDEYEYSPYLAGKRVFVFQDNDKAGREHAQHVCASVSKYAQAVQLVELTGLPEKGDVSDHLQAHTPAELFALMQTAPVWTLPAELPTNAEAKGKSVVPAVPTAPAGPPMPPEEAATLTTELLETIRGWILTYVVVTTEQAEVLAVWIAHTYVFTVFEVTPYVFISSPEKGSGKSTLLRILKAVACRSRSSSGMSGAALARVVKASRPSLFLDELDAQMKGNKETAENIRGILNSGYEPEGVYTRCVGKDFAVTDYPTFCPKCLAGIGELWDTVSDRSIIIEMRRMLPGESIEPDRQLAVKAAATPIKARLEEWAARGAADLLRSIHPMPIYGFNPRQNDIAEVLLAIAQLAGGEWPQRLTQALKTVFKATGAGDMSTGVTLLSDTRAVFDERGTVHIPSKELAALLCEIEGRPWAEWSNGKGLTANNLARQLKKFKIYPGKIRLGPAETAQGYRRGDFEDVWSRYCLLPPIQTGTTEQPASLLAETAFSNQNTHSSVPVAKSASDPHEQRGVPVVPVQNRGVAISEMRI